MTPVPVRGWNPLAGLSALALRPTQNGVVSAPSASAGDDELIRLCDAFCEAEVRRYAEAPPDDVPATFDQDAFDEFMDVVDEQQDGLLEQISKLPPTTLDGARALARAYRAVTMDDCFNPLTMGIDERLLDASEPSSEDKLLCVLLHALGDDPELDRRLERHRRVKAGVWAERD